MRITPYNAQVVYMESKRMETNEINLETFLLRCDLLNVKNFCNIKASESDLYQVITTSLMEIVRLKNIVKDSPLPMLNYMEGINSGVATTNTILRDTGEINMKDYLDGKGFGSNPIIKYAFLTLTGRHAERSNLDKKMMKDFILDRKINEELPALDKVLEKINSDLKDIESLIDTQKKVKVDLGLEKTKQYIEDIRNAIDNKETEVEIEGMAENISNLETKLFTILQQAQKQGRLTLGIEDSVASSIKKYNDTIEYIDNSLKNSNTRMEHVLVNQKGLIDNLDQSKDRITTSLKQAQDNFEQLVKLQKEINIQDIIEDVEKIINTNNSLKENTSEHASLIQGVSVRIVHVQKSIEVLDDVMQSLNKLVKREAILGLAQTETKINKITKNLGGM